MATFKSLDALLNHIRKDADAIAKTTLVQANIDIQQASIEVSVYDAYEPTKYKRRRESGGLTDRSNYSIERVRQGAYAVTNVARSTDGSFEIAPLVYGGHGYRGLEYDYPYGARTSSGKLCPYAKPRDYITPAVHALRDTAAQTLKAELDNHGYKTR